MQDTRYKEIKNAHAANVKVYDLEERTFQFAKNVRSLLKKLPKTLSNIEDIRQVARSSGSIGANYLEANDALGQKDFLMHIRISRKEAKETRYWLLLLGIENDVALDNERSALAQEALEFVKIFSSIISKVKA